jgi:hypothetical protein
MKVSYGLTNFAISPIPPVHHLRLNIQPSGSKGERRAIATIATETDDEMTIRSTRPSVISGFVLWTFVRKDEFWKQEGKPTCQGGEVDEMEMRDTLTAAKRLMKRSGREVRD